jgi:hypothetical protein
MTFEEFKETLRQDSPPEIESELLTALWYDAKVDLQTHAVRNH